MDHEIRNRPSFATVELTLDAGEQVRAEAGAMVSYGDGIQMETNATGGFLKSLRRGLFGGESFFQNTFTAAEEGTVTFAPPLPGDVVHHELDTGHVVAFEEGTDFTVRRVGGLKSTLLSGEGLVAEFGGEGRVWLQTRSPDSFLAWLVPKLPVRSTPQGPHQ